MKLLPQIRPSNQNSVCGRSLKRSVRLSWKESDHSVIEYNKEPMSEDIRSADGLPSSVTQAPDCEKQVVEVKI